MLAPRHSRWVLAALCLLAVHSAAHAQTCAVFGIQDYPFNQCEAVAIGDVTGDGKADMVASRRGFQGLRLRIGDGRGGFGASLDRALPFQWKALHMADLDGDGHNEILASRDQSSEVRVVSCPVGGAWSLGATLSCASQVQRAATADLNGDGYVDAIVPCASSGLVFVHLGDGAAGFGSAPSQILVPGGSPTAVAIGRIDGDAHLDLVTSRAAGNSVAVYLGAGDGTFSGPTYVPTGTQAVAVVLADFDGDALLDLAAAHRAGDTVRVRLGDGTADFAGASATFPMPEHPVALAASDLDADSRIDLAVACRDSSVLVKLKGNGQGGFSAAPPVRIGGHPTSVACVDVDGDRVPDTFTANDASDTVSYVPSGARGATPLPMSGSPSSHAAADFNEDGALDLVVTEWDTSLGASIHRGLALLVGDGNGAFAAPVAVDATSNLRSAVTGDLDGDGHQDVVAVEVSSPPSATPSAAVRVYLGDGGGSFTTGAPQPIPGAAWPALFTLIALGDLNHDAHLDVVAANGALVVMLGDGSGGFAAPVTVLSPAPLADLELGDMNGDNHLDAVLFSNLPQIITILLGDGAGGFGAPLTPSIALSTSNSMCLAHLNADTHLDVVAVSGDILYTALGDGAGGFSSQFVGSSDTEPGAQYDFEGSAVADLNGDGLTDVITTSTHSFGIETEGGFAGVHLGDGAGHFRFAGFARTGQNPQAVVAADCNGDQKPDALVLNGPIGAAGGPLLGGVELCVNQTERPGAVMVYGSATAGAGGFMPAYTARGCAVAGRFLSFEVDSAPAGTFAVLVFGFAQAAQPLPIGGELLVGDVIQDFPVLPLTGAGAGGGAGFFVAPIPPGLAGFTIYSQAFVLDPGVIYGLTASNGVQVTF
jgi:hypothetical protein